MAPITKPKRPEIVQSIIDNINKGDVLYLNIENESVLDIFEYIELLEIAYE